MPIELRRATEDDRRAIATADGRAFGITYTEERLADQRSVVDLERFWVAVEGIEIIGVTGSYSFLMTVPGGASLPVAGITWVSVQPTHRRQGVLRRLMDAQHRALIDDGVPIAVLTASEGAIYERFGYGAATVNRGITIDRRRARLRDGLPSSGSVRLVDAAEARELVPARHEAWRVRTPGGLSRSAAYWDYLMLDREDWREGMSANFWAVHPEGFIRYRRKFVWDDGQPGGEASAMDVFASSDAAEIDLWRFLLGLDLVGPITRWDVSPGDPLPFYFADGRTPRVTYELEGMWVRLLDVPAALSARRYATEGSLVLEVVDPFLDRGGRVRLEAGHGTAWASESGHEPDLVLGVAALGAVYLGTHRPSTLARVGLVEECTPGALVRADALFAAERPARYGTPF